MTNSSNAEPSRAIDRPTVPASVAALLPVALAVLVAWPSLDARFVSGDDERLILNHVLVSRPTPSHAWTLLTRLTDDLYQPVAMISYQLNYAAAGPDERGQYPVSPRGFHAVNIALHAANALLVFFVLRRIFGCVRIALVAGSLFAVHPFAVETYAWINGRMILLATFFALCATRLALTAPRNQVLLRPFLVVVFWILSLASKPLVTAPVIAALVDLRRGESRRAGRFVLHGIVILLTLGTALLAARSTLDTVGLDALTDSGRGPLAVQVIMAARYYLENVVWPARLAAWSPPTTESSLTSWPVILGGLEMAALLGATLLLAKRHRRVANSLAAFIVLLAPFLAAGTTRFFLAADRYMYLPLIALHAAVASAFVSTADGIGRRLGRVVGGKVIGFGVIAVVIALLVQSRRLCETWQDSVTRDRRVAEVWPNRPEVYAQLAKSCLFEQQPEAARGVLQEANARWPGHPRLAAVMGDLCRRTGDLAGAERWLNVARAGMPDHLRTQYQYALTLEELGREAEARAGYERILERSGRFLPAVTALARYYKRRGDPQRAETYYRRALEINPYHPDGLRFVAQAARARGNADEAIGCLNRLLALLPEDREARLWRAALWRETRPADAEREYRSMLARDASDLEATIGLHRTLAHQGRYEELPRLWEEPAFVTVTEARAWRAWALALAGKPDEASHLASAIPESAPERLFADWARVYSALKGGDTDEALMTVGDPDRAAKLAGHTDEMHGMLLDAFSRLPEKASHHPAAYYVAAMSFYARGAATDLDAAEMVCEKILATTSEESWRNKVRTLMQAIRARRPSASSTGPP